MSIPMETNISSAGTHKYLFNRAITTAGDIDAYIDD